MANKNRKCSKCGLSFPAETIKKIGSKNYCQNCYNARNKETKDYTELTDTIKKYLNPEKGEWPLLMKQIKQYKDEFGFKYEGISLAIKYSFEYDQDFEYIREYGLGFLSYEYQKATQFYFLQKKANKCNEFTIDDFFELPAEKITVNRSDLYKQDQEHEEKQKLLHKKRILTLDDVEDDGITINDIFFKKEYKKKYYNNTEE